VFHKEYLRLPHNDETFALPPGRTWGAARNWSAKHGHTLRTLLGMPRLQSVDFAWTIEGIREAAIAFRREDGRWPTVKHGACEAFGGRGWNAANSWLRETHGLSLASLQPPKNEYHDTSLSPRWRAVGPSPGRLSVLDMEASL
jgi:hypothetical protein